MRLAFMGTPDFAVPTLRALVQAGHEVVVAYSQPPRPGGRRGLDLVASPLHKAAQELGIEVFTPITFDEGEVHRLSAFNLDVCVVVAYGLLLPASVLAVPRFGCYNGHASLLPRWRGAAPIQRAIMAGDSETGMMVMKMETGLDTGSIALTQKLALPATITAGQLHDELARIGADLMVEAMGQLQSGQLKLQPQAQTGVSYAHKITKQETRIDWARPAIEIERKIRGLAPAPTAWCEMEIAGRRERVKILTVSFATQDNPQELSVVCGGGDKLSLTKLQKAGSKPLSAAEFLRGHFVQNIT